MKLNVPLLPLSVEFRWRPLQPLEPLRFSIRQLFVLILIIAGCFGLLAELCRHNDAIAYHREQSFEELRKPPSNPLDSPFDSRLRSSMLHQLQWIQHESAHQTVELLLVLYVIAVGLVVTVFVVGRVLARIGERRDASRPD